MGSRPSAEAYDLSQIVQGTSIPTFVINRDHVTTHWNRACENLTGIPAGSVIGTCDHWKAFYGRQRPVMADLIVDETAEAGIASFYGGKYRRSSVIDGAYEAEDFFPELGKGGRWLFFTASPLRDREGRVVGAIETLQDVTDQQRAERGLRESEERYRILTEHMADGVILVQGDRLVFCNQAFVALLGRSNPEELVGAPLAEALSGPLAGELARYLEEAGSGAGEQRVLEGPCPQPEGDELWLEVRVDRILMHGESAVLASFRDVTESRRQRKAMEEEAEHLRREYLRLRSTVRERYRFGDLIGKSAAMQEVYELILKAAETEANVIIHGESGTGKELVAKAIHELSDRSGAAFVPVNCGAIPESLVESEFFGYRKGAFTGAAVDKKGHLDVAENGTLFLDEVGEIGLHMQVKLLRALGEGGFTPVGGSEVKRPDVRVIAATSRNLADLVRQGRMRKDFFYRISVVPIHLPPLRRRREDLPLLLEHYLNAYGGQGNVPPLPGRVIEALIRYDWPGNVRELQNVLRRYLTLGKLEFTHDPPAAIADPEDLDFEVGQGGAGDLRTAVRGLEKKLILCALDRNRWRRGKTAAELGIDPKTLSTRMKEFGLSEPRES